MESDRESQYFGALEKKESYETKLLETHVIEAEIYYCKQVGKPGNMLVRTYFFLYMKD